MKRIFTLLALMLSGAAVFASAMTDNGHKLTDLWAQYDEAHKADRPVKELEILKQIKEKAAAEHFVVDFYDAATAYVSTAQRRDWKQREPALKALEEEVKALDEPIVTFLWMNDYQNASTDWQWKYVKENIDRFQGRNTPFYRSISSYLGGNLAPFIQTDKEYVLWRMLSRRSYINIEDDEIYQALKAEVAGKYPNEPALEYYVIGAKYRYSDQESAKKAALEALEAKYQGKAVSMYPRGALLQMQMEKLSREKAPHTEFKALYNACEAFEEDRKAFTGDEARILNGYYSVKSLSDRLTAQNLSVEADRQTAKVTFQNLKQATLVLYKGSASDGKKVKTWKLTNPVGSFYVTDTLQVAMPVLADGSYELEVSQGEIEDRATYNQYTLSVAVRATADGWQVYVTDHKSGEPLEKVKLRLYKSGKQQATASVTQNGFTALPKTFNKIISKNSQAYYSLVAESGNRSSGSVSLHDYYYSWDNSDTSCNIYRDRGAYNPGDTLQFKLVMFQGSSKKGYSVCADNKLKVELRDSEGNMLEEKDVKTNAYGSASGSFVLPKGLRNGYFTLTVRRSSSSGILERDSFRVDEFVLPTFNLTFDEDDKLYLVGDDVNLSGKIESYSGHSLTGARVTARVTCYDDVIFEDSQEVGTDNTFHFVYPAPRAGAYHTEVTVTDATGETRSFRTYKYIGDRIRVSMSVRDAADGNFVIADAEDEPISNAYRRSDGRYIIEGNSLKVYLEVEDAEGGKIPVSPEFMLLDGAGKAVRTGKVDSGTEVTIDLADLPSGLYTFTASASTLARDGETELKDSAKCRILLTRPADKSLTPAVTRFYVSGPTTVGDGYMSVRLGSNYGPVWGVATLFGEDRKILDNKVFKLEQGVPGEIGFAYAATYPDAVRVQVFYFQDGESVEIERQYRRAKDKLSLPLRFTRFQSDAYPGTEYGFALQTDPGVEALASAWDKSLDAIAPNYWSVVSLGDYYVPSVSISSACGHITGEKGFDPDIPIRLRGGVLLSKAAGSMEDGMMLEEAMVALPSPMARNESADRISGDDAQMAEPVIRSEFSSALTFQPHLLSNEDGTLEFKFRTSDKLSTYYVTVYAHGKDMRNALVQQEMVVSLPVKVALVEPQFLYAGDRYEAALTVSSISDEPVSGRLQLRYGNKMQEIPVTVPAGEVVSHRFVVEIPDQVEDDAITLTASFISKEFSDAVQVKVPVYPASQVLTEAHSAILLSGMDREALLKELRSRFVNVPGAEALLKEITVMDMVRDAIPSHVEPSGKDVLSLSEAWYVQLLADRLGAEGIWRSSERPAVPGILPEGKIVEGEKAAGDSRGQSPLRGDATGSVSPSLNELLEKVMACQNSDGGFGWFEGMNSSAMITAVMLERFAKLKARGFEVPDMTKAVKFLDKTQFGTSFPVWRGWVSDAQYMHVRALYPEVEFTVKAVSKADKKRMDQFKKDAKAYLLPSKKDGRGLQGQILSKARRLLTLKHLSESEAGVALSGAWGVTLDQTKLSKSMQEDLLSLVEYAVEHRDGGWYYPNAVMPWRGLMESEAYAHSLLCDLMAAEGDGVLSPSAKNYADATGSVSPSPATIADGIRLWLMLQKETQKWETDPAFVDAITSILDGSKAVLDTRVLALSATYEAPFSKIKAAGNGFTIERKFYKEVTEELLYDDATLDKNRQVSVRKEIKPGDPVKVGDKIRVEYQIWNGENRSFVKLDAAREAALRPVQQLSGHIGWSFRNFTPQGYRNVKADRTEYFFDSYPEEKTTITEEFFVTQAGAFVAPVVTIESLYAPHYRANSASRGVLISEAE